MTIILHDHTHTIRVGRVPAHTVLDLAAMLPADVRLSVRPDEDAGLLASEGPRDPGYFGLAVALARRTWEG
jgi:hypothetical protein